MLNVCWLGDNTPTLSANQKQVLPWPTLQADSMVPNTLTKQLLLELAYTMQALSIEEQISRLRATMTFAPHMHKWFLAGAATGVIAAVVFWHPVPLMIAAFLGIVGLSEQRAGPNIVSAILAYDSDTATNGQVSVEITTWDTDNTYHATVSEAGQFDWKFEFIPQGWQPASRSYRARVWRTDSDGRPVLVVVEEGILIPRYDPKPIDSRDSNTNHP